MTAEPCWRCERCNAWEYRNGGPPPPCPWCDKDLDNHERFKGILMVKAVRVAPVVKPSVWEDL